MEVSKSVLDLKQAKDKAVNLTNSLKELTRAVVKLEPMSKEIAQKFKALSSLPDCQNLLQDSN